MSSLEIVRELQERAARAQPAEQVENLKGWWLRNAPQCSWWVGSVLPHGEVGPDDLLRRVVGAEEFHHGHRTTARFQICPPACPEEARHTFSRARIPPTGLGVVTDGFDCSCPRIAAGKASDGFVEGPVGRGSDARRFDVWCEVRGHGDDDGARAEWDLLGRVGRPSGYISVVLGEEVVAVGRAVVDTGWSGVFSVATLPAARGKGAAWTVLAARPAGRANTKPDTCICRWSAKTPRL